MTCMECVTLIVKSNFKAMMFKSNLGYYSDAYILVKGTMSVPNTTTAEAAANKNEMKISI